jgi:Tfp pilus assembly protein FimV
VDNARKEEKKASLDYGRKVDAEAGVITSKIVDMIDVHEKPLKDIENREKERVIAHEKAYEGLTVYEHALEVDCHSITIKMLIEELRALEPDENYEEFTAAAIKAYKKSMAALESALKQAEVRESEQAELLKLRAEFEERDRQEREAQIAKDAAEKAEREAQAKVDQAERDKQQAIEREEQLKRDAEAAEQRRIDEVKQAEENQKKAVAEAEERTKRDAEQAEIREREEADKREANQKHKAKVNNEAVAALVAGGIPKDVAKDVVTLIAKREIPNVVISY